MTDWVEFLRTYFNLYYFNLYYVLPGLFALVVFWVQWCERNNKSFFLLATQVGAIFPVVLAIQYLIIFLVWGTLPAPLSTFTKIIVALALIYLLLVVLYHTTKGTGLGNRISSILDKHFSSGAIPVPAPLLDGQLEKLRRAREILNNGDRDELEMARQDVIESSAGALMILQEASPRKEDIIRSIHASAKSCERDFLTLCNASKHSPEQRRITATSLSKLIGVLEVMRSNDESPK